jgi:hypothetical protein
MKSKITMKLQLHIAFATLGMFLGMNQMHAQAPNLGAASTFGLFTAVGAIDNLANTVITGDVGTDVGAFNGFPPAVVLGQIHVADPVSAQVALDVNLAYAELGANPCGTVLGTGLGNGQILTPDNYCIGAAAIMDGDLTFDAQNDPNALFIVKIDGALSTNLGSRVLLLNGAAQCNIYWQVNGAVDFGDNSAFQGVLFANGQMTFLVGASLEGKALAIQGAIALNENIINTCSPSLLAVTLTSFEAQTGDLGTVTNVTWQTALESNSDYFLIERSLDGDHFETIGKQMASGWSDHVIDYAFTDENPMLGTNYYRLQQVDQDGVVNFSAIRSLTFSGDNNVLSVFPNPFSASLVLRFDQEMKDSNFEWQLLDATGKQIKRQTLQSPITLVEMTQIPSGFYLYRLFRNGVVIQTERLMAQQ